MRLLELLRAGLLSGDKLLLGGSTAALRFCALIASACTPPPLGTPLSTTSELPLSDPYSARPTSAPACASPPGTHCITHELQQHFEDMVYRRGDTSATLAPMM